MGWWKNLLFAHEFLYREDRMLDDILGVIQLILRYRYNAVVFQLNKNSTKFM